MPYQRPAYYAGALYRLCISSSWWAPRTPTFSPGWHILYDQQGGTVEVSFYLGERVQADGTRHERRSDYLTVALDAV